MMNTVLCIISFMSILTAHILPENEIQFEPLSDEMIAYINQHPDAGWTASRSDRFKSLEDARILLGAMHEDEELRKKRRPTVDHQNVSLEIPSSFDSRKKWHQCKSISNIRDQSRCGSCWAFAAVEAMSDRICIESKGKKSVELSAVDLLSCCTECGLGCQGGFPGAAWDYWVEDGIVTGSSKENHTGCQPYPFPKCEHHTTGKYPECGEKIYKTPKCHQKCQKGYKTPYKKDKYYGRMSYNVLNNENAIKKEIMMHGPVEVAFTVHSDFLNYKSGIYKYMTGAEIGEHAVRIIGWGVEKKTPYWLIANSWNEDWGEKGYFRMLRGKDECGIESAVTSGLPRD
uniref:Cathepsin B-like cysteine proteinase n=1 Tax=Trichobilharzia regenti TaxID=157069 RepID=Q4VRW6_TRIRE|nr:cathepsin B1 isotype 4 precursor [Trichobilharzia regenti]